LRIAKSVLLKKGVGRMRKFSLIIIAFLIFFFGYSTAKAPPDVIAADVAKLVVDFSWEQTEMCSSVSPEIKVAGFPESTKSFKVTLRDLDTISPDPFYHGGGTVANDGSGVIAAGSLKYYKGPCPQIGIHRYVFTVKAVDADGRIIGIGKQMKKFP
jgi:phosphatidylethanolamine-binding protein (PEBP) family uncharacterized protein